MLGPGKPPGAAGADGGPGGGGAWKPRPSWPGADGTGALPGGGWNIPGAPGGGGALQKEAGQKITSSERNTSKKTGGEMTIL